MTEYTKFEKELINSTPVDVLVSVLSRSLFDKHDDVLDGCSSELEDWLETLDFMLEGIGHLRDLVKDKMTEEADALITEHYANILACKQDMEYMLNCLLYTSPSPRDS